MPKTQVRVMNEEDTEVVPDGELLDFDNPSFVFKPNEAHDWRQQGPYLVCKGCEITHAVFIGMGKILTGLDEKGKPILKPR